MSTSAWDGSRGQVGCTSSLLSPGGGQPCHFPLTLSPLSLFTLSHLSFLKLCHLFSLFSCSEYSVTLLPLQIVQCGSFVFISAKPWITTQYSTRNWMGCSWRWKKIHDGSESYSSSLLQYWKLRTGELRISFSYRQQLAWPIWNSHNPQFLHGHKAWFKFQRQLSII